MSPHRRRLGDGVKPAHKSACALTPRQGWPPVRPATLYLPISGLGASSVLRLSLPSNPELGLSMNSRWTAALAPRSRRCLARFRLTSRSKDPCAVALVVRAGASLSPAISQMDELQQHDGAADLAVLLCRNCDSDPIAPFAGLSIPANSGGVSWPIGLRRFCKRRAAAAWDDQGQRRTRLSEPRIAEARHGAGPCRDCSPACRTRQAPGT
jgi:hypothetical protein